MDNRNTCLVYLLANLPVLTQSCWCWFKHSRPSPQTFNGNLLCSSLNLFPCPVVFLFWYIYRYICTIVELNSTAMPSLHAFVLSSQALSLQTCIFLRGEGCRETFVLPRYVFHNPNESFQKLIGKHTALVLECDCSLSLICRFF